MLFLSSAFNPPVLKGLKVYLQEPLRFDFILDPGQENDPSQEKTKKAAEKLIKYFLASLTIPEEDLWVNLSPYEKDRIIPETFGRTQMGRDLLEEDYILKQLVASLLYPEGETGKRFWQKVYALAQEKYGTTDIPVDVFNKVWIVPEKAVVYENTKAGEVYITDSRLKVLLEQDYLATELNSAQAKIVRDSGRQPLEEKESVAGAQDIARSVLRDVVIPVLEKEVNEGGNFALLRQVYQSLILATWYKRKIKRSLLASVYVNRRKIAGINIAGLNAAEEIWQRYADSFRKGTHDLVVEQGSLYSDEVTVRRYFSGGFVLSAGAVLEAISEAAPQNRADSFWVVEMELDPLFGAEEDRSQSVSYAIIEKMRKGVPLSSSEVGLLGFPDEESFFAAVEQIAHKEVKKMDLAFLPSSFYGKQSRLYLAADALFGLKENYDDWGISLSDSWHSFNLTRNRLGGMVTHMLLFSGSLEKEDHVFFRRTTAAVELIRTLTAEDMQAAGSRFVDNFFELFDGHIRRGVFNGDMKRENLGMTANNELRVLDFGRSADMLVSDFFSRTQQIASAVYVFYDLRDELYGIDRSLGKYFEDRLGEYYSMKLPPAGISEHAKMALLPPMIIKLVSALKAGMPQSRENYYVYPFLGGAVDTAIVGFVEGALAGRGQGDALGGIDFNPGKINIDAADSGEVYAENNFAAELFEKISGFFVRIRSIRNDTGFAPSFLFVFDAPPAL